MGPVSWFVVELLIGACTAGVVCAVLTRPLRRLLLELCGTAERARFWVAYSDVMIFLAPLVFIVAFGKSGDPGVPSVAFYRAAIGSTLLGLFVALAFVGLQLTRLLPRHATAVGASDTSSHVGTDARIPL